MKTVTHPRNAREKLLHVEADGVLVNIRVGLTDAEGHPVTRIDISPDDKSRGGDGTGYYWYQDGPRIIRLHPGEEPPITGTVEFTGATVSDVEDALEAALDSIRQGNTSGFDRNETGSYSFQLSGVRN